VTFERELIESGKCAGSMGGVMIIRYTPNRGYRGKDSATVVLRYPEFEGGNYMRAKHYRYNIDVR
jgi:hypothetical protein